MEYFGSSVHIVSIERWFHLCSPPSWWWVLVAHEPADICGPQVKTGWWCEEISRWEVAWENNTAVSFIVCKFVCPSGERNIKLTQNFVWIALWKQITSNTYINWTIILKLIFSKGLWECDSGFGSISVLLKYTNYSPPLGVKIWTEIFTILLAFVKSNTQCEVTVHTVLFEQEYFSNCGDMSCSHQ